MNTSPLVSVIMPAYNSEKYIFEAIDSILNQSFKDFEFIIIDDGSNDKTWEIIQEYKNKDGRIVALRNERNLNNYACRNKGIKIAKGKYIIWQDSDDISLPARVSEQVEFMENHPKVGICGTYMKAFNQKGENHLRKYAITDKDIRKKIFKFTPVAQPSGIIRKQCYEKVGLYEETESISQDLDMTFRIGEHYELANIAELLVLYREHPDSLTHKKIKRQITNTLKIRMKYMFSSEYSYDLTDVLALIITFFSQFLPLGCIYRIFYIFKNFLLKLD